jgi:hypothetical protein
MLFRSHIRRWIFNLGLLALAPALALSQGTYTTRFPSTENPLSEGGHRWIQGRAVGLDWQNVRTNRGLAFGTQSGSSGQFDDSTAVLNGTWGPNQTVQARAYVTNAPPRVGAEEVELRLRSTITAHNCIGYEINFSTSKGLSSQSYMQIVRWNGPLGNFTVLATYSGSQYGVVNGDLVKATITGTPSATITVYVNGKQVGQVTDPKAFTSGSPGMGFWLKEPSLSAASYGFTDFMATDASTTTGPALPTNHAAIVH